MPECINVIRENCINFQTQEMLLFEQVTDASLLTITGFPAFAVGDDSLRQQTKAMVKEALEVIMKRLYSTCAYFSFAFLLKLFLL